MLLISFSVLILKNLFLNSAEIFKSNCDEIGHTHFFSKQLNNQQNFSSDRTSNDKNCHSAQNLSVIYLYPSEIFHFQKPNYNFVFETVFSLKNNQKSPFLEPRRKPPRFS